MLFIRGLYNEEALKGNIHSSQTGNLLSGAPLASGGEIRSGTSIDQLLAQTLRPLDQGAEPRAGLREVEPVGPQELLDALQLAHLVELADHADAAGTLSRRWPSTGCSRTKCSSGDKSVLDAVLADAQRPAPARSARPTSASSTSTSTRSATSSSASSTPASRASCKAGGRRSTSPNIPRPADGIPQDIAEHMRLMCDILVLGFQTDTTRISTLKLNNDHSSLRFPHLGVDYMIHHLLSHSDTADWLKVNQFFLEQLAYIARKLDAIQEGDAHAARQLDAAVLLEHADRQPRRRRSCRSCCSAAAAARSRAAACSTTADKPNRQMCRLYLSMMDKMNVRLESSATRPSRWRKCRQELSSPGRLQRTALRTNVFWPAGGEGTVARRFSFMPLKAMILPRPYSGCFTTMP